MADVNDPGGARFFSGPAVQKEDAMIDLGTYKDRFAESGQRVLEHAVQESRRRDQNYIAVEHILNGLAAEEVSCSTRRCATSRSTRARSRC